MLLGYNSACVDFAVVDEKTVIYSHVVTAVEIGDDWLIEDATYNVTYSDISGNPISIEKIQSYLLNGNHEKIIQVRGINDWRPYIFSGQSDDYLEKRRTVEVNGSVMVSMTSADYQNDFIDCFSYFEESGYGKDALYMFLYPYDIYDINRKAFSTQKLPELVYQAKDNKT